MSALAVYAPLLPELILAVGAMALLMLGVFRPETQGEASRIMGLAVAVLLAAGFAVLQGIGTHQLFDGAFIVDSFARFMKIVVLVGAAGALVLSFDEMTEHNSLKFEYPVLVLLAAAGMMMMISANDLISLYLGLELQSLALYVVAAIRRDSIRSSEAGLKYFVLGALSSGMLLYGASLLYGFAGATSFQAIAAAARAPGAGQDLLLIFGLVFLLVGVAFKISAVPFHMWTPDVYEGAPTPVTAFFASAPKVAAMALFIRVVVSMFAGVQPQWQQIVVFLAIASMLLGAFAAIRQTNIKRLMAYSSIANMGYALVGLAAGTVEGVQGVLIYMAIYVVMTLGAFACILAMRRDGTAVEDISELAGLSRTNLPMAFAMAMFMFSLAGIPPLAGFFAKLYVFMAAIKAELYGLAVIGVLASVVGAYYYLRIVKLMFFDEARQPFEPTPAKERAVQWVAMVLVIGFVLPIISAPLVEAAAAAARTLF
ncbi:MAG: NADH-quinone oxidoreductase subunit NuoN [Hyphomicrobiaceae bacterium]